MSPYEIVERLHRFRLPHCSERELQDGIAEVLRDLPSLKREARLNAADRPDFFLESDGIAIEVKIKGSCESVRRQLDRYARIECVKGIVLVTTRLQQSLRMPYQLEGKPLVVYWLSSLC